MDRLLALWCPGLAEDGPRSEEARTFAAVLRVVKERCPFAMPIRLGLAVLPAKAPSRFFGGEQAVCDLLLADLAEMEEAIGEVRLGIADGLFAAVLAARDELLIPEGMTSAFLATRSVASLRRAELAGILERLGVRTLGAFADLDPDRVIERFGSDGAHCHRVARGLEGELVGIRDPGVEARLLALEEAPIAPGQPTFFGGTSLLDERAAAAALRLQHRLDPSSVLTGSLQAGNDPAERASLLPFSAVATSDRSGREQAAPWPGQLPAPSPTTVLADPAAVTLTDPAGAPVGVSARGLLTGVPGRCWLPGERAEDVVAWAGPWPLASRWWDRRRNRSRLQVLTASGVGLLLGRERGAWWLLGRYD